MIDRTALTLKAVSERLPGRNGEHAHRTTILRWINKGIPGANGQRIRLAAVKVGATLFVTEEALAQFMEATNAPLDQPEQAPQRTPAARHKATERAVAHLVEMGA